jgi:hypothetical protein
MREISKLVALAGGVALAAGLVYAADQTILGKSLTVKDPTAGSDAKRRSIKGAAKEKGSSAPLNGNPTLANSAGGAILDIFAFGTNPTQQSFPLPQGTSSTGKPFWSAIGNNKGFKYKDLAGDQGPVKSLIIKKSPSGAFSIKAKLTGKHGTISVIPPNTGTGGCMAVKLGTGGGAGDRYSVDFRTGNVKNVDAKLFSVKKPTAKAVCPVVSPTTSTTTTTTSSTTTTTHYGSPSRAFLQPVGDLLD